MNIPKPKSYYVWRVYGNDCVFTSIQFGEHDMIMGIDLAIPTLNAVQSYFRFNADAIIYNDRSLVSELDQLRQEITELRNQLAANPNGN